ncbi:4588_t:CDS:2 [Entrophospora sp. SA101]|nr:14705_t:CDS:2 [Entrophospora sp. SA101]CAJ0642570.1 4588_t:CDS:2 [Entrophospora sp. SA101]CAJ0835353.1 5291_t:CDS:2 [Entrophospora sp. SA101]
MDIESLFGVNGKKVLITGGSRGIGLMIAKGFVSNGAKVYISSRSSNACDQLKLKQIIQTKMLLSGPGEAISLPADLQKLSEVKRLVSEIEKREDGKLDVLVNNAGANWGEKFDKYPDEAFEKVMNLNLKKVFSLTQAAMPLLEKAATPEDPARVINISSVSVPYSETYAYDASKAALNHLTKVMAGHLSQRNVTFNGVLPGPFETKMMKKTLEDYGKSIVAGIPLGRIGRPEDLAGTCIYLASKAGAFTNGALITVDGGDTCKPKL